MGADNMMVVIERAMAAGNSVLIENMGEAIDAALNPVITRCGAGSRAVEGRRGRSAARLAAAWLPADWRLHDCLRQPCSRYNGSCCA